MSVAVETHNEHSDTVKVVHKREHEDTVLLVATPSSHLLIPTPKETVQILVEALEEEEMVPVPAPECQLVVVVEEMEKLVIHLLAPTVNVTTVNAPVM